MSNPRIAARFAALKAANRLGLVTFITAGDPNYETCQEILLGLPAMGADIIELGMPFSDPIADGPAIQAASLRALSSGMNVARTLELVAELRTQNKTTPVVLMGYYNPIYRYGVQPFARDAAAAGVDGVIVVDLPPEEDAECREPLASVAIDFIRLVTPTTTPQRLQTIAAHASGFLYYVTLTGVTGTQDMAVDDTREALQRLRSQVKLPVAAGFGIKSAQQIAALQGAADAVVVGSAIVREIEKTLNTPKETANATLQFVKHLAGGLV